MIIILKMVATKDKLVKLDVNGQVYNKTSTHLQ